MFPASYGYVPLSVALLVGAGALAGPVEFTLLTHPDNEQLLPQPRAEEGVSGDHLLHTPDDFGNELFNPDRCFSFNFLNPQGVQEPYYPPGYAEGIHSMTGSLLLEIDLLAGGPVGISSLVLDGYVAPGKPLAHQRLILPGDPATDGSHGLVDGQPNAGTYAASAASNWAFDAAFDWYYDTPFPAPDGIDMTFDEYAWHGFLIPVGELTEEGMAVAALDDPLDYYGGDFEAWLLAEVVPRLPEDATWLLFAQGEASPEWRHEMMGMTPEGIIGETIIAYATVPEPATLLLLACGVGALAASMRRRQP